MKHLYFMYIVLLPEVMSSWFGQPRRVNISCKCLPEFTKAACNDSIPNIRKNDSCPCIDCTENEIYKYCPQGTLGSRNRPSSSQREFQDMTTTSTCMYIDRVALESRLIALGNHGTCISQLKKLCPTQRERTWNRAKNMLSYQHQQYAKKSRQLHGVTRQHYAPQPAPNLPPKVTAIPYFVAKR